MNNKTVNELNNRNLDSCYFSIICFPTNIYFKSSEIDNNQKTLYVFYGCNLKGVRKFITAVISDDFFFICFGLVGLYNVLAYLRTLGFPILIKGVDHIIIHMGNMDSQRFAIRNFTLKLLPCGMVVAPS